MIFHIRLNKCLLIEACITGMDKYSNAKDESVGNVSYLSSLHHETGSKFFPIGASRMYLKK